MSKDAHWAFTEKPREPTAQEVDELYVACSTDDKFKGNDDTLLLSDFRYVAIFDDYIPGGHAFRGKVAIVLWGMSWVSFFGYHPDTKKWEELNDCSFD